MLLGIDAEEQPADRDNPPGHNRAEVERRSLGHPDHRGRLP